MYELPTLYFDVNICTIELIYNQDKMYSMRILLLSHTHCTVGVKKKENSAKVVAQLLALLNQKLLWENLFLVKNC